MILQEENFEYAEGEKSYKQANTTHVKYRIFVSYPTR